MSEIALLRTWFGDYAPRIDGGDWQVGPRDDFDNVEVRFATRAPRMFCQCLGRHEIDRFIIEQKRQPVEDPIAGIGIALGLLEHRTKPKISEQGHKILYSLTMRILDAYCRAKLDEAIQKGR